MDKDSYTRNEIYELLWSEASKKVAFRIGISDVALGKWCKQYGVPKPPVGYWAKVASGKKVIEKPPLEPWWNEYIPEVKVRARALILDASVDLDNIEKLFGFIREDDCYHEFTITPIPSINSVESSFVWGRVSATFRKLAD